MTTSTVEPRTQEGWHTCEDGEKLYFKVWKTQARPKARMVHVHGFGDHCNTNIVLFRMLASQGIEVFGFDQRGWGRSVKHPRQRGRSGPTSQVLSDISSVLGRFIPTPSTDPNDKGASLTPLETPLFLYGHSMGGAEILHYAAKHPNPHIRGYLAEAPLVALDPKTKPFDITVILGRMASVILPNFQLYQPLNDSLFTRDKAVNERIVADPLCHSYGTLRGLEGMLNRAEELDTHRLRVDVGKSIWIGHGTADGICAFDRTKIWFDHCCGIADKTFRSYEGWFHVLHEELGEDKELYASEVSEWILARSQDA